MSESIQHVIDNRKISRICHFTPARNFREMLSGKTGILNTSALRDDEKALFTQTDAQRYDGKLNHICATIEYPNMYYFHKAQQAEVYFKEWVVLLISTKHLINEQTWFCANNAALGRGQNLIQGDAGFASMFSDVVSGSSGNSYRRSPKHLICCPTDAQAEVLIFDHIPLSDIIGVVYPSEEAAHLDFVRHQMLGLDYVCPPRIISPDFFERTNTWRNITQGIKPNETFWTHDE